MRVACTKCAYQFESLIIDRDRAMQEIAEKSTRHVQEKHKALVAEMSQAVQISVVALTTLMHYGEFLMVPEEEDYIQEKLGEAQDIVMSAIGYDSSDDDDGNAGEDEYDDDDDGIIPREDFNDGVEPDSGVIELPSEEDTLATPPNNP